MDGVTRDLFALLRVVDLCWLCESRKDDQQARYFCQIAVTRNKLLGSYTICFIGNLVSKVCTRLLERDSDQIANKII